MPLTVLMAHGWGFDAGSLRALADALGGRGVSSILVEDGQLGAAPDWPLPEPPFAVLGHSAGFPRVLRRFGVDCLAAIAVNGFTRFAAGPGFPDGVPPRVLSRMVARLSGDPVAVVDAFRTVHGAGPLWSGGVLDPRRLVAGLRELAGNDEGAALDRIRARGVPVLALCAPDDVLVTPAHARACFREDEIRWEEGGHLLPLRRPERCADLVAGFLGSGGGAGRPLPREGTVG